MDFPWTNIQPEQYDTWIATLRTLLDDGIKNKELGPRGSSDPLVEGIEDYMQYFLRESNTLPQISHFKRFLFRPFIKKRSKKAIQSHERSLNNFFRINQHQTAARRRYTALVELAYYGKLPMYPNDSPWPEEQQLKIMLSTACRKEVRDLLIPLASRALSVVQEFSSASGIQDGIPEMIDNLQEHVLAIADNALSFPRDYTLHQVFIARCDICVQEFFELIKIPLDRHPHTDDIAIRNTIKDLDEIRREFEYAKELQTKRLNLTLDKVLPQDLQIPETLTPKKVLHAIMGYMNVRVFDKEQCVPVRDFSAFSFGGFGFAEPAELVGVDKVIIKRIQIPQWSATPWKFYARILREIRVMMNTNNRHVLPLLGICLPDNDTLDCPGLVLPFCKEGDLRSFLNKKPSTSTIIRLQLISDIASGLEYLHNGNPHIIHGDIKGDNILVRFWDDPDSKRYEACLCDFGISRLLDGFTQWSSGIIHGNRRWLAPELVARKHDGSNQEMTTETDMYSFGCVFLEGMTGSVPYSQLSNDDVVEVQKMTPPRTPGFYLPQAPAIPHQYLHFMKQCWDPVPKSRPNAKMAVRALEDYISEEE